MMIESHALKKSYGPRPALRGCSLALQEGEIVAVTGPSGCGKSTLLHVMAGILRPDSGEVRYRGVRIDDMSETRRSLLRRTEFGVLFQFGQLVAELPAVENVALPLLLGGTRRPAATVQAAEWLERLGVAELAQELPGEMSGGQQQRVALARALVTGPKVLFADEPTGALDSLAGELVMGHLVRAARTQGVGVLLVTHDATVAAYADREIRLRDGVVDGDDGAPLGAAHSNGVTATAR
ncbi:ABC transporter ATP-binding protein [Streptomyces sp. NBC_00481]|uniref:ABC transporter ATP-binding protein n=1 Tax=unclassified Streptomyces TaxID=2593676 RepID=UPI002DDA79E5|nr:MULTISPECIES: ABC transporter ATP-binding protein [unclassified Streptomyces]WRY96895.1 ABC transporter ATP-binding protein [Streptomyces sp. NBC_00481]